MSGGSYSAVPYYQPNVKPNNKDVVKPLRIEKDSKGKRLYYYSCQECGKEFKSGRRKQYSKTYCGEACRIEAFAAIAAKRRGTKRTEEDIKKISKGQKKVWNDLEVRNRRIKGMHENSRGSDKKPRKSRKKKNVYTCSGCGRIFETSRKKTGKRKYHSKTCRNENQGKFQKKGTLETCANPNCENEFYRKKSRKDRKYCSMNCAKSDPNYWKKVSETQKEQSKRDWEWAGWDDWRTDRQVWDPIARRIRNGDNRVCQSCDKKWKRGMRTFHVHHILPRRLGGPDEDWNLITLCPSCHARTEGRGGPIRYPPIS